MTRLEREGGYAHNMFRHELARKTWSKKGSGYRSAHEIAGSPAQATGNNEQCCRATADVSYMWFWI
jgi:hypothetical protein